MTVANDSSAGSHDVFAKFSQHAEAAAGNCVALLNLADYYEESMESASKIMGAYADAAHFFEAYAQSIRLLEQTLKTAPASSPDKTARMKELVTMGRDTIHSRELWSMGDPYAEWWDEFRDYWDDEEEYRGSVAEFLAVE